MAGTTELDPLISKLLNQAQLAATRTREHATLCDALLEAYDSKLSVFGPDPFPKGKVPEVPVLKGKSRDKGWKKRASSICDIKTDVQALKWALDKTCMKVYVTAWMNELAERKDKDDATADPSGLGVFATMLGQVDLRYLHSAIRQATFISDTLLKMENGASSHRYDDLECWSDFIYMAPPFLAYLAVAAEDTKWMTDALKEVKDHREVLCVTEEKEKGLWRHIVAKDEDHADLACWSTGCGKAAMGMAKVLAVMKKWVETSKWVDEQVRVSQIYGALFLAFGAKRCSLSSHKQSEVESYIKEIIDGAMAQEPDPENGLLRNYIGVPSYCGEASGTAMLAATVYRMAVMLPDQYGNEYVEWADKLALAVYKCVKEDGLVKPVANPLKYGEREPLEGVSVEGQCFVVLMYTAERAYKGNLNMDDMLR